MEKRKIKDLKREIILPLLPLKNLTSLKYGSEENTFLRLNATVHTNGRTLIMK